MNKKIVTLILVILISFCFLSIVVADNATHDDNNTSDHDDTIDKNETTDNDKVDKNKTTDNDKVDKNKITDKENTPDINETDDKPKNNYILAIGNENDITFSDGFRGFILDYSKSPASSGDEFERVSTSYAPNSNTLKLAIIECYKQDLTAQIGGVMADFVRTGSSSNKVGEAVAASNEKVSDCEAVKINNNTEAVFEFEVLKSVSGNESDYFAYRVSFRTIDDGTDINQANGAATAAPNANNTTNTTHITQPNNNGTNATFLDSLYDYLTSLVNSFYDSWKPFIDTIINGFLMFINTLGGLVKLFEDFIMEIRNLINILGTLLKMLGSIGGILEGILKLLGMILTAIQQLINLIEYIFNFIVGLIYTIISLLEQIVGLLAYLIDFIIDTINQIMSLIQAVWDFLKSSGSFFGKVIENAVAIITSFVIITIGAFVYKRIR